MSTSLVQNILKSKKSITKPSVYGNVLDGHLFNFGVDPNKLKNHMPSLKWLEPRNVKGYEMISFCLANLKELTISPLPETLGINTVR